MPEEQAKLEKLMAAVESQGRLLEETAVSVRKIRGYMFWTAVVTVAFFVLPLIGLAFAVPYYLSTLTASLSGL